MVLFSFRIYMYIFNFIILNGMKKNLNKIWLKCKEVTVYVDKNNFIFSLN